MNIEAMGIKLGGIIVKTIIKCIANKNISIDYFADDTVDIFSNAGLDVIEKRKLSRGFEELGDQISSNYIYIFNGFDIEGSSKESIINECIDTIKKSDINLETIASMSYNHKIIYEYMLNSNKNYNKYYTEQEIEAYKKCLSLACDYIIDIVSKADGFQITSFKELYIRFDRFFEQLNNVIDEIHKISAQVNQNNEISFESDYRQALIRKFSKLNLFGADISRNVKRYNLSIAYVEMDMKNKDNDDYYKVTVNDILQDNSVSIIVGEAGSGKTTLIQWLAIKMAAREIKINTSLIPIVIELRKIKKDDDINISYFVKNAVQDVVSQLPSNWEGKILNEGRVLLLIDGFDEISEEKRQKVLNWIEELYENYPIKIILTSRPCTYDELDGNVCYNNQKIEILPMNYANKIKFINYWHNAVLESQGLENSENVNMIKNKLIDSLNYNTAVNKLAASPLLCAMICALHYSKNLMLPSDKNELYEECCKMLLDARDRERDIKSNEYVNLTYRQKKGILSNLAYWMLRNGKVSISIEDVSDKISSKARNMGIIGDEEDSESLIKYFIERSGIIREPEEDIIDFIHKTFQEYLAAEEICRENDWGVLVRNADDTTWHETIILACGFATTKNADNVIKSILNKSLGNKIYKTKYRLLAMACAESALELSSNIREEINTIASKVIPPKIEECGQVAICGDLAIKYLYNKDNYTLEQRRACLTVLKLINSPSVLPVMASYINNDMPIELASEVELILDNSSVKDIEISKVSELIIDYVKNEIQDDRLFISYSYIRAISKVPNIEEKLNCFSDIRVMTLYNFNGEIYFLNKMNLSISKLSLIGEFHNLDILYEIDGIKELVIDSTYDEKFDFYKICNYSSLNSLEKLTIIGIYGEYLSFNEFNNLININSLELNILNIVKEIDCESFCIFEKLKTLTLSGDGIFNIDFSLINDLDNIEVVNIIINSKAMISSITEYSNLALLFNKKINIGVVEKIIGVKDECGVISYIREILDSKYIDWNIEIIKD